MNTAKHGQILLKPHSIFKFKKGDIVFSEKSGTVFIVESMVQYVTTGGVYANKYKLKSVSGNITELHETTLQDILYLRCFMRGL